MLWYQKIDISERIDINKTSVNLVTIGFLKILDLNLNNMFFINAMVY